MDSREYYLQHPFGCPQKGGRIIHEWDVKDALILHLTQHKSSK
jgi:hypothetical protein